jgi:hypothetical protein
MRKSVATVLAVVSALSIAMTGCGGAKTTAPSSPAAPSEQQTAPATPPVTTPPAAEPPKTEPAPQPEPPKPVKKEMPNPVHGILLSGWYAGSPDLSGPLLDWAKNAGINTVVLDLKAEDGNISWISEIPMAKAIGANEKKIADFPALIKDLHDRGFWVAGRIVTFNDKYMYRAHPEWGIPGFPGGDYSFMDPKNENVWDYNISVAKEAVKYGVDEIQFDYVRYPDKLVSGYNKDTGPEYRTENIGNFLKKAYSELHPLGVVVGADLFGLTTSVAEGDDMQIGQDYAKVAGIVDYVAAMAYPSHYALNTYGIDNPNRHPYETIKNSMGRALDRTKGVPIEKHRPWIQDFNWDGFRYGPDQIAAQIQALKELGINSYMLWDPSCKFTRGLDYNKL